MMCIVLQVCQFIKPQKPPLNAGLKTCATKSFYSLLEVLKICYFSFDYA